MEVGKQGCSQDREEKQDNIYRVQDEIVKQLHQLGSLDPGNKEEDYECLVLQLCIELGAYKGVDYKQVLNDSKFEKAGNVGRPDSDRPAAPDH